MNITLCPAAIFTPPCGPAWDLFTWVRIQTYKPTWSCNRIWIKVGIACSIRVCFGDMWPTYIWVRTLPWSLLIQVTATLYISAWGKCKYESVHMQYIHADITYACNYGSDFEFGYSEELRWYTSLVPCPTPRAGERAWFQLFAHALNRSRIVNMKNIWPFCHIWLGQCKLFMYKKILSAEIINKCLCYLEN